MSRTEFPEDKKINLMLVVPMLHQGGFERVCVKTARLLAPLYNVTIAVFDLSDAAFDLEGLHVEELGIGAADSRIAKILNVPRRVRALKKLKREALRILAPMLNVSYDQLRQRARRRRLRVAAASAIMDDEARKAEYQALEKKIISEDAAWIPLYADMHLYCRGSRVASFTPQWAGFTDFYGIDVELQK